MPTPGELQQVLLMKRGVRRARDPGGRPMLTTGEFRQVEVMNRTLQRIADALEAIAEAIAPEGDEPDDGQ